MESDISFQHISILIDPNAAPNGQIFRDVASRDFLSPFCRGKSFGISFCRPTGCVCVRLSQGAPSFLKRPPHCKRDTPHSIPGACRSAVRTASTFRASSQVGFYRKFLNPKPKQPFDLRTTTTTTISTYHMPAGSSPPAGTPTSLARSCKSEIRRSCIKLCSFRLPHWIRCGCW